LVSLQLLLDYFWASIVIIAPYILVLFSCFNFYTSIATIFKHQWTDNSFAGIRKNSCSPRDTANTLCNVPYAPTDEINQLCLSMYNSTDCQRIRDSALAASVEYSGQLILAQSLAGVVIILILSYALYTAFHILTTRVFTQSMNDNINYLLLIPIASCAAIGAYYWWMTALDTGFGFTYYPVIFIALACAQCVALPFGIYAGRQKSRLLLAIYMSVVVLIIMLLITCCVLGWVASFFVTYSWSPTQEIIGVVACAKKLIGCSDCVDGSPKCPEWSSEEVRSLVSSDFKLAGTAAACCITYFVGALIIAHLVRQNLKEYRCEFV